MRKVKWNRVIAKDGKGNLVWVSVPATPADKRLARANAQRRLAVQHRREPQRV